MRDLFKPERPVEQKVDGTRGGNDELVCKTMHIGRIVGNSYGLC